MAAKPTWQFPANEAGQIEGPIDSGIEHFTGNRDENVIRESIQNSLDARPDDNRPYPVRVEFSVVPLPSAEIGAAQLAAALQAAANSPHNDNEAYREQFQNAARRLRGIGNGSVDCLRIIDSNTSGASDDSRSNKAPSKWEALTKGTGSSAKPQKDAAGSFGIGKFSAFAVADMRTVLYSTAYESKAAKGLTRRFIGRTILVSHERGSEKYLKTGYFSGDNFHPLRDTDVPRPFRLTAPGTALYILGYEPKDGWRNATISAAVKHFFHALVHNKLNAVVDRQEINAKTLPRFERLLDKETANFVRVSQRTPDAETDIPDIGHVILRIEERSGGRDREIALVRDAGMMITARLRNMNLPGLGRLPQHWNGFTAVIECLSRGEQSLLRDSESPQHDRISTDYIVDPKRKRQARERLAELGEWVRSEIAKRAEPPVAGGDNAEEMAKHLPIEDDGAEKNTAGSSANGRSRRPVVSLPPYQQNSAPPRSRIRGSGSRGPVTSPGDGTATGNRDGQEGGVKSDPRKPIVRAVSNAPTAFAKPRFRAGAYDPNYSLIASFDNANEPLLNVRLVAVGEDGQDVPIGIREAYIDGQRMPVSNDAIQSINGDGERLTIEFRTREPIANKTFYLKGESE